MLSKIYHWVVSLIPRKGCKEPTLFYFEKVTLDDFNSSVEIWNYTNFLDHWWREKHNIAFGSAKHLEANLIDIFFEYREDLLYNKLRNSEKYEPNKGKWIKEKLDENKSEEQTFEEFKEEISGLDLSQFDDK